MSTVSERIRTVRQTVEGRKMSQDEFGQRIGLSRSAVANLEDAENRLTDGIPESTLKLICATFHVQYKWLTTGEGDMYERMDADALVDKYMANEPEFSKSIMRAFAKMPDEEWERFRDLVERIKKEGA